MTQEQIFLQVLDVVREAIEKFWPTLAFLAGLNFVLGWLNSVLFGRKQGV